MPFHVSLLFGIKVKKCNWYLRENKQIYLHCYAFNKQISGAIDRSI